MENSPLENHISRYEYTQTFKEKVVLEVFYQGMDIQRAVQEYGLPSIYTVQLWLRQFQKRLDSGMIVLPPMPEEQKATLKASEQRIKELEKALEFANIVIFSLNHMLDFAEKNTCFPSEKSLVPNSEAYSTKKACKAFCRSSLQTVW